MDQVGPEQLRCDIEARAREEVESKGSAGHFTPPSGGSTPPSLPRWFRRRVAVAGG
jgi:hypothetical protein